MECPFRFIADEIHCVPYKGLSPHEGYMNCPLIEIVTCKDCKWCDDVGEQRALVCNNELIDTDIHPNFFCGYGERRNDEYNH